MGEQEITLPLETARRLFRVFNAWWNEIGTMESDSPGLNFISIEDTQVMDDLCDAVEEIDSIMLLRLRLGLDEET
jgi:hypothetical protein